MPRSTGSHAGLATLSALEASARGLRPGRDAEEFRALQYALWNDLRMQGNPWRITDFVTIGAPMALADLFVARPRVWSGMTESDRSRSRRALRPPGATRRRDAMPAAFRNTGPSRRSRKTPTSAWSAPMADATSWARRRRSPYPLDQSLVPRHAGRPARRLVRGRVSPALRCRRPRPARRRRRSRGRPPRSGSPSVLHPPRR